MVSTEPHPQYQTLYPQDRQPQYPQAQVADGAHAVANPDVMKPLGNLLNSAPKKVGAIIGGLAVGAGIIGGTVYATSGEDAPKKPAVEAAPVPGDANHDGFLSKSEIQTMSPEAVAKVDPTVLVATYGPDFDAWRKDTLTIQINHNTLTPEELAVLTAPEGPKDQYSDQDVLNQVSLDIADASIQQDLEEGKRMLPLPMNPEAGGFSDTLGNIEPNNGPVLDVYKQFDGSLPRPQGSFNGVSLSDYSQARLIPQEHMVNNGSGESFKEYGLYGLIKNGQNEEWQLLRRWTTEDSSFANALNELVSSGGAQQ